MSSWQPPVLINDDDIGPQPPLNNLRDRVCGTMGSNERPQVIQPEPGHSPAGIDDFLPQHLQAERLTGACRPADSKILFSLHPLQSR